MDVVVTDAGRLRKASRASASVPGATPLVSVLMANYNGAPHLPQALNSVLGQTVREIEVIVADDASSDRSVDIVRQFAQRDRRVRLIGSAENRGPGAARNDALQAARGEWVAIVDADDIIHPERLEILLSAAQSLGADAVADDLLFFSETAEASGTTLLGQAFSNGPEQVPAGYLIRSNTFGTELPALGYLKPVFRRARLADVSYNEEIRVAEDFDFLLRFLLRDRSLFVVPQPLYLYRRHAASISHRLSEAKVLGMIAGHERLIDDHPAMLSELRGLLGIRSKALHRALKFERLVEAVKRRRVTDVLRFLAADPGLAIPLARSAVVHARDAVRKDAPAPRRWTTLVLCKRGAMPAGAQALLAELGLDANVEFVAVPPYEPPSERSPRDKTAAHPWRRLIERSMAEDLYVVAHGLEGIHAMGFIPRRSGATVILDESDEFERALACISRTQTRLVVAEKVLAAMHPEGKTKPLAAGYHIVEEGTACSAWRAKAGAVDAR